MQVYRDLYRAEPPPCTLLAIRGMRFELGEPPGREALDHLAQALAWGQGWLTAPGSTDGGVRTNGGASATVVTVHAAN